MTSSGGVLQGTNGSNGLTGEAASCGNLDITVLLNESRKVRPVDKKRVLKSEVPSVIH